MNGIACNGWRLFTRVEDLKPTCEGSIEPSQAKRGHSLGKPKTTLVPTAINRITEIDQTIMAAPKTKHVRNITKVGNQKSSPEGMTKFWCTGCMASFLVPTDEGAPESCLVGHPAMIVDELATDAI
jgi:hypothetical protein